LRDGGLCRRIEQPDRLDVIAEKLNAQGVGIRRRVDIDNPATDAELAWNFNDGNSPVSQAEEVGRERFTLEGSGHLEAKDRLLESRAWDQAVHDRGDGCDEYGGWLSQQSMERRHSARDQPDMRRGRLIGKRFPLWEPSQIVDGAADEFMEKAQVVKEPFCGFVAPCDHNPWLGADRISLLSASKQRQCAGCGRPMRSKKTNTRLLMVER
jgi:hypothetical protein